MRIILTDKFDLGMFKKYPIKVIVDKISKEEVCFNLEFSQEEGELVNTITDEEMLVQLNDYCGLVLDKGKNTEVKLEGNDRVYVVEKKEDKLIIYEILTDDCLLD